MNNPELQNWLNFNDFTNYIIPEWLERKGITEKLTCVSLKAVIKWIASHTLISHRRIIWHI
jgi:hypothetical protein